MQELFGKRFEVALFDMDGTLVDTEGLWAEALADVLQRQGALDANAAECLALLYGKSWRDAHALLKGRWPEAVGSSDEMAEALRRTFTRLFDREMPIIEPSVALLKRLAGEGVKIAVVSGSPREDIETVLGRLEVRSLVPVVVSCEDCSKGKPDPEGYCRALEELGVSAEAGIAFEDSEVGVAAAKSAGLFTVGLKRPGALPQDLSSADHQTPSL